MREASRSTSTVSCASGCSQTPSALHGCEAAAWRVFVFNWKLLAVITGTVIALLLTTEFRIEPLGYVLVMTIATLYWKFGRRHLGTTRWNPRISFCLVTLGQLAFAIAVLTTLTYLATAAAMPLQDKLLLSWDLTLGLDFRTYLDLINRHPEVLRLLGPCYSSITWQLVAVAILLPMLGLYRRIGKAVCAFILSLIATTFISSIVPAIGVYDSLNLSPIDYPHFDPNGYYDTARDAPLVRSGNLRLLDLPRLVGVLTFPSFHAVSAILYMWAFLPVRWLRPLAILWNAGMILATPLGGWHYFVDVAAGIVVALIAIGSAQRIAERVGSVAETAADHATNVVPSEQGSRHSSRGSSSGPE